MDKKYWWRKPPLFETKKLKETTEYLCNPGRGWYQIYTFYVPENPKFEDLIWCLKEEESLVLVVINIGAYRDRMLDDDAAKCIRSILMFFQQHRKDVILRLVYDSEGRGLENEPMLFSNVQKHFYDLLNLVNEFSDTIFILQGLLIGSWGEMHTSKFVSQTFLKRLYAQAKEITCNKVWIAVRKPMQWRMLQEKIENEKLCLFDDAILASDSHMGTFGTEHSGWCNAWIAEKELEFEDKLCRKVPIGGEVVAPKEIKKLSEAVVLQRLKKMHISYLNCVHDEKMLGYWRSKKIWGDSVWKGYSLYDYIGAHMGYRFCIRDAAVQKKDNFYELKVMIENIGFAPCYEECSVEIKIDQRDGESLFIETGWDVRGWTCEEKIEEVCCFPKTDGKILISIKRRKDKRPVYFANEYEEDGWVHLGNIFG